MKISGKKWEELGGKVESAALVEGKSCWCLENGEGRRKWWFLPEFWGRNGKLQ